MPVGSWTILPQTAFGEMLEHGAVNVTVGPQALVTGTPTGNFLRTFHLQFALVNSQDCAAMLAVFRNQKGGYFPFTFVNPNDGISYLVRFDPLMHADLFTPIYFQANPLVFTVVRS